MLRVKKGTDLSKYGFTKVEYIIERHEKRITQGFICAIYKKTYMSFEAQDVWNDEINLDFLYEMIKDGVIGKVEST